MTNPSDTATTQMYNISYFNLLCDLDEAERVHEASKNDGSCPNEIASHYRRVNKLKDQVNRDGKKLDGEKLRRARCLSTTTVILGAYLAEYPDGSVTVSSAGTISLFDWANKNVDIAFGYAEITAVDRHDSITFLDTRTGNEQISQRDYLKTSLSKVRKSINSK